MAYNLKAMAVSDESAAGPKQEHRGKAFWKRVQYEYEKSATPHRQLAKQFNVPYSTLAKRAMRDKWSVRAKLVQDQAVKLESAITEHIKQEIRDELAPFIEAEKVKITKLGVKLASKGLRRIDKLWKTKQPTESKQEADSARAVESLVRVVRTSLGMSDGSSPTGNLNLQILTGSAAVQVVSAPSQV